jgi:hypothetical protein
MRSRFLAVVVLGALAFGAARASAHDKFRFIGTVVKMDVKKNLLTMKTNDKAYPPVLEIDITRKTRIERNGQKAPVADLKPGVHVVVDALGDDYFDVAAVLVRIVPPPSK